MSAQRTHGVISPLRSRRALLWGLGVAMVSLAARAEVTESVMQGAAREAVTSAKVYYLGEVDDAGAVALMSALDRLNAGYPALRRITLMIKSDGGSVYSGYLAYEAIRQSRVPVTTVNAVKVGPAALLLYCAGQAREAATQAQFIIGAAPPPPLADVLTPQEMAPVRAETAAANALLRRVLGACSDYDEAQAGRLLAEDGGVTYLSAAQAQARHLVTQLRTDEGAAQVVYYLRQSPLR